MTLWRESTFEEVMSEHSYCIFYGYKTNYPTCKTSQSLPEDGKEESPSGLTKQTTDQTSSCSEILLYPDYHLITLTLH